MLISSSVYSKDTCKYTAKNLVINGNHETFYDNKHINIYEKNPPKITKSTSKINLKVGAGKKI